MIWRKCRRAAKPLCFVLILSFFISFANVWQNESKTNVHALGEQDFAYWFNEDGATTVSAGVQGNANISALQDMVAKGNTVQDANGVSYYTVQGTSNPKTAGSGSKGTVPDEGAAMMVTAPLAGTLTVHGINGAGKTFYIVNGTTGEVILEDSTLTTVAHTFEVLEGNDYWFYSGGSKFQFAGFEFVEGGSAEVPVEPEVPVPTPTPEPIIGNDTGGDWVFTRFGASTSDTVNKVLDGASIDGEVKLESASYNDDGSINKKGGKYVSDAPADGISLYYTSYNPQTENFVLQADVTIDYMNPTPDGQEGFALMTRDSLSGSGSYFSNLFSVSGTKLPVDGSEIKDVIGVRNYTGIVNNEDAAQNSVVAVREGFDLERSMLEQGKTYRVRLEKTSYGYISTQLDVDTNEVIGQYTHYIKAKDPTATSVSSYAELDDPMTVLEEDLAYLGLSVARGVNATFTNIEFTKTAWDANEWVPQPLNTVDLNLRVTSPLDTSSLNYDLVFQANADGVATITVNGVELDTPVTALANTVITQTLELNDGPNEISITFAPDDTFMVDEYTALADYSPVTQTQTVTVRRLLGDVLYVKQDGLPENTGSSYEDALDMQTALSYVGPGQKILVYPGEYDMSDQSLYMARGSGGTAEAPVIIEADPEIGGHAHFNFGYTGGGFTTYANYVNYKNLAFSHTAPGQKGMQLGGSHNTLENMIFFNNGTTGLQISGSSLDAPELWPSYNTVINATSMNNADPALEDADGFAPKLTTGPGNTFTGSIAAYNADDGWDLFAKAATGSIGQVVIEDSLAYRNGYILLNPSSTVPASMVETRWDLENPTPLQDGPLNMVFPEFIITENGELQLAGTIGQDVRVIRAGNGNGFKMGGTNMPGDHEIYNSIAYENKAKGFDSNSGPDIKVFDSTSYNNGSYNIALYTNNLSATTDYAVNGFISYRKPDENAPSIREQLRMQGQEDTSVYGANNYYWDVNAELSANTDGKNVDDSWFVSLDTSIVPGRTPGGSIDMKGLLILTEEAKDFATGARYNSFEPMAVVEPEPTTDPVETIETTEATTEVTTVETEPTTVETEATTEVTTTVETEVTTEATQATETSTVAETEETSDITTTSTDSPIEDEVVQTGESAKKIVWGLVLLVLATVGFILTRKLRKEEK